MCDRSASNETDGGGLPGNPRPQGNGPRPDTAVMFLPWDSCDATDPSRSPNPRPSRWRAPRGGRGTRGSARTRWSTSTCRWPTRNSSSRSTVRRRRRTTGRHRGHEHRPGPRRPPGPGPVQQAGRTAWTRPGGDHRRHRDRVPARADGRRPGHHRIRGVHRRGRLQPARPGGRDQTGHEGDDAFHLALHGASIPPYRPRCEDISRLLGR
jgi:hypothetical protein